MTNQQTHSRCNLRPCLEVLCHSSYVICSHETSKLEMSEFESCGPQFETSEMSLTEKFIENRHYVCAIDEVSHEHFRGFPVEIDLEGPQDGDEEDSGYVPTPEHEREELMPDVSGELLGNLLQQHEARGHWPYDKGCDSCVQARGRTPARRRRHQGGDENSPALISMAADFTFLDSSR